MTLRELKAKLEGTSTKLKEIRDAAMARGGDLTEDETRQADQLETEYRATERLIRVQTLTDEHDRRAAGTPLNGGPDGGFERLGESIGYLETIRAQCDLGGDLGPAREWSAEFARRSGLQPQGIFIPLERRTLTTTTPAAGPGGNLIATEHLADQHIDLLRANSILGPLGVTYLRGLTGNVEIPKTTKGQTAVWLAEEAPIPFSDMEFGKVAMTPKHVANRTELSRNMLLQTSPAAEQLARQDMQDAIMMAIEAAALAGSGVAPTPRGVLNQAGIHDVDMATVAWDAVQEMIEVIETANSAGTGWAMNPSTRRRLRSTLKTPGDTASNFIMESPTALSGYQAVTSTIVPANTLVYGKWSDVLVGVWAALDLLVNPYAESSYAKGAVQIRGIATVDVAIRHAESFSKADNVGGAP